MGCIKHTRRIVHAVCALAIALPVGLAASAASAQDWTKSKWGPKDEIGAHNLITPKSVRQAAKLIKTGKTYPLGLWSTPRRRPFRRAP